MVGIKWSSTLRLLFLWVWLSKRSTVVETLSFSFRCKNFDVEVNMVTNQTIVSKVAKGVLPLFYLVPPSRSSFKTLPEVPDYVQKVSASIQLNSAPPTCMLHIHPVMQTFVIIVTIY